MIIMPAHNEEKVIEDTLKELTSVIDGSNILVVDDGSTDSTLEKIKKFNVNIIHRNANGGYSCALRTGIHYFLNKAKNYKGIIFYDSDGQHKPEFILKILEKEGDCDIVIGSRFKGDLSKMPLSRRIGNFGISLITALFAHKFITDTQSGIRLIKRHVLEQVELKSSYYAISSELIVKTARRFKICEVPITAIYDEYTTKKGTNVKTGIKVLYEIIKTSLGREGLRKCDPSNYIVVKEVSSTV